MLPAEPEEAGAALRIDDAWWPRTPRPGSVFRHTVGARAVDMDAWLVPRKLDGTLVTWKRAMLDAVHPRVFSALPGSEAASVQVLETVQRKVAGRVRRRVPSAHLHASDRHPLEAAARLVAEDLAVMDVSQGAPKLVAACVTMPNRWLLADKMGQDMLGIHGPVPGYEKDIGTASDRLLANLAEGRVLARGTWNLVDDPALFQPSARAGLGHDGRPVRVDSAGDAGRLLWVRTEYQTLSALPGGGVLFTIRTGREPLADLADRPDRADSLLALLEAMPPEQYEHKGVVAAEPVTAWLRQCARRRLA